MTDAAADQLRLIFDVAETSWDGLWFIDLSGEIQQTNYEMRQLCGTDELSGPVWPWLAAADRDRLRQRLQAITQGAEAGASFEQTIRRDDGTTTRATVHESVFIGPSGTATGLLQRVVDARRNDAIWRAHRAGQAQLTNAQLIERSGEWQWDLADHRLTINQALVDQLDVQQPAGQLDVDGALAVIHPDDRPLIDAAISHALHNEDHALAFTVRMQIGDEWRWVCGRGAPVLGPDGQVALFRGTLADVDDTQTTKLALQDQVAQTALMHTVSVAANSASGLTDLIRMGRDLILVHDDWQRGTIFAVQGDELEPIYADEAQRTEDEVDPGLYARELALAHEVLATDEMRWDERRLTLALPVHHAGRVHLVIVATSAPPLYRHRMIEEFASHMALQAELVIEREQAALQLAQARDDAMASFRQRSQFLAMMTQEIRTPLNGLIGLNQLLLRTDLDPDQERMARGAEASGKALMTLVNDTLDLSKAEAGRLTLEETVFDIRALVSNVVAPLVESANDKGVELRVDYGSVPAGLRGDPVRLAQVLGNLISNALKFTAAGEICVALDGQQEGDAWILHCEVTDSGIGIEEGVGDLFTPYVQASAATTKEFGGTGLGLAISREIVEAMGGEIGYRSTLGVGSTFHFTARFAPADLAEELEHTPYVEHAARVLVVEDHPINQDVAIGMLTALGQEVRVVGDAEAALQLLADEEFDAIFMDVQLPGMDGHQATRELRALGNDRPIIGMSATSSAQDREQGLASGMNDFVSKPVDMVQLAAVLNRWVEATAVATETTGTIDFASTELDIDRLEMLRTMDEADISYLERAITNFINRRDTELAGIAEAAASGDAEVIRFKAHRLVGGADNIGARRVAELARELELGADDLAPDEAVARVPELSAALDSACADLSGYLDAARRAG